MICDSQAHHGRSHQLCPAVEILLLLVYIILSGYSKELEKQKKKEKGKPKIYNSFVLSTDIFSLIDDDDDIFQLLYSDVLIQVAF